MPTALARLQTRPVLSAECEGHTILRLQPAMARPLFLRLERLSYTPRDAPEATPRGHTAGRIQLDGPPTGPRPSRTTCPPACDPVWTGLLWSIIQSIEKRSAKHLQADSWSEDPEDGVQDGKRPADKRSGKAVKK